MSVAVAAPVHQQMEFIEDKFVTPVRMGCSFGGNCMFCELRNADPEQCGETSEVPLVNDWENPMFCTGWKVCKNTKCRVLLKQSEEHFIHMEYSDLVKQFTNPIIKRSNGEIATDWKIASAVVRFEIGGPLFVRVGTRTEKIHIHKWVPYQTFLAWNTTK